MTIHILLYIASHSCGYEDVFTKMYSWLGDLFNESLSMQINIIDTRGQYERVYKNNTHAKMMKPQILQQKIRYENPSQSKYEMKVFFFGIDCGLVSIFKGEATIRATKIKYILKMCVWFWQVLSCLFVLFRGNKGCSMGWWVAPWVIALWTIGCPMVSGWQPAFNIDTNLFPFV